MLARGQPILFACLGISFLSALAVPTAPTPQISTQAYKWQNVRIGGGGGFVPGIVFNPSQKGLAYARTDIGGVYKLNADDSWTALVDFADNDHWDYWGSDAIATDPVDPNRLYIVHSVHRNIQLTCTDVWSRLRGCTQISGTLIMGRS